MSTQSMAPVNARVRAEERDTFYRICDMIGTTPSNAIRMFVSAFNRRRLSFRYGKPVRIQHGDPASHGRRRKRPEPQRSLRQR